MLNIKSIVCNPLQENCYIVSDAATGDTAIIDCGACYDAERQAIDAYIDSNRLRPTHLLCTHGHFDHIMGCAYIEKQYGLLPEIHADDELMLHNLPQQMQQMMGHTAGLAPLKAGRLLADGDTVTLGDSLLRVRHAPGHTPGGIILIDDSGHTAFAGDTLFRMSVGRTDLEGGSWPQLMNTLATVIAQLEADTTVYCGHGPHTTVADELRFNPWLHAAVQPTPATDS